MRSTVLRLVEFRILRVSVFRLVLHTDINGGYHMSFQILV